MHAAVACADKFVRTQHQDTGPCPPPLHQVCNKLLMGSTGFDATLSAHAGCPVGHWQQLLDVSEAFGILCLQEHDVLLCKYACVAVANMGGRGGASLRGKFPRHAPTARGRVAPLVRAQGCGVSSIHSEVGCWQVRASMRVWVVLCTFVNRV